jgi:hypothetical protein
VSDKPEKRYECIHGHRWTSHPFAGLRCPGCGTVTLREVCGNPECVNGIDMHVNAPCTECQRRAA